MPPHAPVALLLVDEVSTFVRGLAALLRRESFHVDTADHGELALTQLQERRYDVILYGLNLPDLDGPTFYAILQSQYPSLCQRVIFLTGEPWTADSLTFLEQCGQPWLLTPCTIRAVRNAILQVLRAQTRLEQPRRIS